MQGLNRFKWMSYITLIVLFLLIGVGGLVRVTGSGMGCPDWPKCFGLWLPPNCECQLPDNYHEIYKDHGYPEGVNFDPLKTAIEYINRLLGVFAGFLVLITFFLAYKVRKVHKAIFTGTLLCLILVILEGGIGAMVVKLNLQQQSVTLHYFMAIALVSCLLYSIAAVRKLQRDELVNISRKQRSYLIAAILVSALQLFSGANLRSITEGLAGITIYEWLQKNELIFNMHRFYAIIVVVINTLLWLNFKAFEFSKLALIAIVFSVVAQMITGLMLNFANFPQGAQILHILLPAVLFCSQFYILSYLIIKRETRFVSV